jgi:aspartyl-tRNA synthetase
MSFVDIDDVLEMNERMMASVFKDVLDVDIPLPMPRLPYKDAIERFGSDKPDLRFDLELKDLTAVTRSCGFKVFEDAAYVGGIVVPDKFTRKEIDKLTEFVKGLGVKGLAWHKSETSGFAKFIPDMTPLLETAGFDGSDLLLVIADANPSLARSALGALRIECAKRLDMIDHSVFSFTWITEFPLFELDEESGKYNALHHPFTSPMTEDIPLFEKGDLGKCRARAYDMVLNGYELSSGSIRIHDAEIQRMMFELLGLPQKEIESRFGHMIKAFGYGVPPHGGIAFGFDRIVMIMAGTDNIRDVIAFPKTQTAVEVMIDSPSDVDKKQLDELKLMPIRKTFGDIGKLTLEDVDAIVTEDH